MMHFAELLTEEEVRRVHDASLEVLEGVGLLVRNDKARARFGQHGCRVDEETQVVTIPRSVVEHYRQAFPREFTFHGRDPSRDVTIPGDGPRVATSSAAPDLVDPVTGQIRRSRSDDIARIAHLVNELPGYDLFTVSTTADDAPPGQFHLSRYYPALKNCLKPVTCSAPDAAEAQDIYRLGVLIAGSEEAYRQRPFITYVSCPTVSPLTFDVDSTGMLMHFAEQGLPHHAISTPNAGMTSPLTLAATVAICNAEFLAQALLVQMSRPGTPVVYSTLPTVADMRSGAYAPGGIETGVLVMGCAQMARYYSVPSSGFAGLTNAKGNDAQSGFEVGMSALAAALAGADLVHIGCLLDALMVFDFAAAVIGSEIAQMLKRVAQGLSFSEEDLALDLIAQVGPGGTFIDTRHTLKRIRTAAFLPQVADRSPREQWRANGALDAHGRAMRRVHDILTGDNPATFSSDVDARIRAEFEDLVAGEAGPLRSAAVDE
jgi:trimethylamine--corrinoid protein Co-methyltransferase